MKSASSVNRHRLDRMSPLRRLLSGMRSGLQHDVLAFPAPVRRLLASSFVFVIGRAFALPVMVLFLTRQLGLSQHAIGWILGGSMLVATASGVFSGYLADRIPKPRLMAWACVLVALSSLLLSLTAYAWLAFLMLALIESALVLRSIALKSMLAEYLSPVERARAFSMNYLLINLAFALGPLFGTWLFGWALAAPLWIAAGFALLASWLVQNLAVTAPADAALQRPAAVAPARFRDTLRDLRQDRRLLSFTIASMLTSFVFGRFITGYLSQYLISSQGVQAAADLLPAMLMVNTIGVVGLQYLIGKRIQAQSFLRWISMGIMMYVLGLTGFMFADQRWQWMLATALFTVGEVIVIPCEFLCIDMIAPPAQRGSYYGVQSLATLGTALNPVVSGYLLTHFSAHSMFMALISAALAGLLCYVLGMRAQARGSAKPVAPGKVLCSACPRAEQRMASTAVRSLRGFF
ncbi:MFS transporter [Undibacterium sp. CY7W]|uniref:MFS transporter n=1 Tax=Undibacterium rugosum TaxID=2762291 RepID=A0A923I150_9BURK|nr:MFS transporter [Undibacterium rugosum]MBC3934059.1 MFS transporter [Undibacterium rugosum]